MQLSIGADPEMFLLQAGKFVSAHGLIPGTKEAPHKVNRGAVQVDGMAVEFNIDPAKSKEEFLTNINVVRDQLIHMLPGFELASVPFAEFGADYMKTQPEEALELGCDPDFDAYSEGKANQRPNGDVTFRTAGGHVHIGWGEDIPTDDPEHMEACMMLTRELDYYLGLPSLFWDDDDRRRSMYGKAGAFRPKKYGVEYRSLSNAWLKDSKIIEFVYSQTEKCFNNLVRGISIHEFYGKAAKICLDTNDRILAEEIIKTLTKQLSWEEVVSLKGRA